MTLQSIQSVAQLTASVGLKWPNDVVCNAAVACGGAVAAVCGHCSYCSWIGIPIWFWQCPRVLGGFAHIFVGWQVVGGRKVSGCLIEEAGDFRLVGIGINVEVCPASLHTTFPSFAIPCPPPLAGFLIDIIWRLHCPSSIYPSYSTATQNSGNIRRQTVYPPPLPPGFLF